MTEALFLATITSIAELEKYYNLKNVEPAILLPEKYYKYLNMFSKKEADTLFIYCSYNCIIIIKNGY